MEFDMLYLLVMWLCGFVYHMGMQWYIWLMIWLVIHLPGCRRGVMAIVYSVRIVDHKLVF